MANLLVPLPVTLQPQLRAYGATMAVVTCLVLSCMPTGGGLGLSYYKPCPWQRAHCEVPIRLPLPWQRAFGVIPLPWLPHALALAACPWGCHGLGSTHALALAANMPYPLAACPLRRAFALAIACLGSMPMVMCLGLCYVTVCATLAQQHAHECKLDLRRMPWPWTSKYGIYYFSCKIAKIVFKSKFLACGP